MKFVEPRKDKFGNYPIKSSLGDSVEDINQASGQSSKSERLSEMKRRLDMRDGGSVLKNDEIVGPINDMYLKIKTLSVFPNGVGRTSLITNTLINK